MDVDVVSVRACACVFVGVRECVHGCVCVCVCMPPGIVCHWRMCCVCVRAWLCVCQSVCVRVRVRMNVI